MIENFSFKSYAKINLGLEIIGRMPDGYHEIRTIFQTIDLYDTLDIQTDDGTQEIVVTTDNPEIPGGEDNLAFRAASELVRKFNPGKGCNIHIRKNIPAQAGLGGGSSNAAVTLIALIRLWKLEIDITSLLPLAVRLGADVPFFLMGGTALGEGIGEKLTPLPDLQKTPLILAFPGIQVSTKEAYKKTSELLTNKNSTNNITPFVNGEKGIGSLTNDFEKFLFAEYPLLMDITGMMQKLGAIKAGVTGSGAALFGCFKPGTKPGDCLVRLEAAFPRIKFQMTETLNHQDYQRSVR